MVQSSTIKYSQVQYNTVYRTVQYSARNSHQTYTDTDCSQGAFQTRRSGEVYTSVEPTGAQDKYKIIDTIFRLHVTMDDKKQYLVVVY
jgi:hypothetical protein